MARIAIALQTPVAEIKVICENAEHKKADLLIGFKRYNNDKSSETLEQFSKLTEENRKLYVTKPRPLTEDDERLKTLTDEELDEIRNYIEPTKAEKDAANQAITDFVKGQIVYLKKVAFSLEDEKGNFKEVTIPDTREVKLDAKIWEEEGYNSFLDFILDAYLNSVWRQEIITGLYSALLNKDVAEEARRKN